MKKEQSANKPPVVHLHITTLNPVADATLGLGRIISAPVLPEDTEQLSFDEKIDMDDVDPNDEIFRLTWKEMMYRILSRALQASIKSDFKLNFDVPYMMFKEGVREDPQYGFLRCGVSVFSPDGKFVTDYILFVSWWDREFRYVAFHNENYPEISREVRTMGRRKFRLYITTGSGENDERLGIRPSYDVPVPYEYEPSPRYFLKTNDPDVLRKVVADCLPQFGPADELETVTELPYPDMLVSQTPIHDFRTKTVLDGDPVVLKVRYDKDELDYASNRSQITPWDEPWDVRYLWCLEAPIIRRNREVKQAPAWTRRMEQERRKKQ